MRSLVTILAFAGKEIRQVLRQPKLMSALVVGPFIILGLFAAGFQANPPPLETLVVLPEGSGIEERMEEMSEELGDDLQLVGTTRDSDEARALLLNDEVDLVVVAPPDASETIRENEHATILVLHTRLDPFDRAYITVSAQSAVDEVNRVVLSEIAEVAQRRADEYDDALPSARRSMATMADALRRGDEVQARRAQVEALDALTLVERQLGLSSDFLEGVDRSVGEESDSLGQEMSESRTDIEELDTADPAAARQAEQLEEQLGQLEETLTEFRALSPDVLVQPFVADTELAQGEDVPLTTYYSPGVVMVLLQHVVLTFAALSVVNERSTGSTEMFRVGPVRVIEFLAGKFLGYAFLGGLLAVLLVSIIVWVFGTPMLGSWWWAALVFALTMAASLGLGFIIAAAASSDAQAVQFSMLALLFTIFFSGMVVSLSRLADGVRQLAYVAPATAGTQGLQDVMFLARPPSSLNLMVLSIYTVVSFVLAYAWLRRRHVA